MKILALIMVLIASPVQAGWFGPDNYDDCILENVKPDMAKHAVYAVRNACRNKFPATKHEQPVIKHEQPVKKNSYICKSVILSSNEMANIKISVEGDFSSWDSSVYLLNQNNFTIYSPIIKYRIKGSSQEYSDLLGRSFGKLKKHLINKIPNSMISYNIEAALKEVCSVNTSKN